MARLKKVRWGRVRDIQQVKRVLTPKTKVPTAAFSSLPEMLKHLSAWRRLHQLRDHGQVSASTKMSPSSDMRLAQKLNKIRKLERATPLKTGLKGASSLFVPKLPN